MGISSYKRHFKVQNMSMQCYLFVAVSKELWIGDGVAEVGANDVGLEALGWLVGHLDSILQHRDREVVTGIAGQPQPEVGMYSVRIHFLQQKRCQRLFWPGLYS